ncbi:MAG TPA: mycofactocin oligosaccharide methyltransferase MftM [Candidatus Limnocylindria bacterium]|nr:mycofactocin oligosaccharide methyltransferase MftM [Candidatus Limnocylindria bacterium]
MTGTASPLRPPRPLDPFSPGRCGRYEDDVVVVVRADRLPSPAARFTTVTSSFAVGRDVGRLLVVHTMSLGEVDDDVSWRLDAELFSPGWVVGEDIFQRLLTGIVLSGDDDPLACWEGFYRASLDRLASLIGSTAEADATGAAGRTRPASDPEPRTLADYAPVYQHAERLVGAAGTQSLLDLGSCFGFFPLRLAGGDETRRVGAVDIARGTCDLLARMSLRLARPLSVISCDAAGVPLPSGAVDTVTLLHLLEHVDAGHGERILAEAMRLARRRVVVAVPLEQEPCATFGHVRVVSLRDLAGWAADVSNSGRWHAQVDEHHGGWLVVDRVSPRPDPEWAPSAGC